MGHDYRDDPLDGPTAAPANHRVVLENDRVRVLEVVIRAGETAPLHSHLVPHVLIVRSNSHFIRRDAAGTVVFDSRANPAVELPTVVWNEPVPAHTLENTGDSDMLVHAVELLSPLANGEPG